MKQKPHLTANGARYNNARLSLLTIVVLSTLNIFSIVFAERYFLFSAYLPQLIISIGYAISMEIPPEEGQIYIIVSAVIALICVIPYLLCWIFSKKHCGWMIGALVIFAVDSLIFLPDFIAYLTAGDFTMILDLIIRIWAIVSLIDGVRFGLRAKKEPAVADGDGDFFNMTSDTAPAAEAPSGELREMTVTRKKSFSGCAAAMIIHVNGQQAVSLKNGETKTFSAPVEGFELSASISSGFAAAATQVEAGYAPVSYQATVKTGLMAGRIVFEKTV